MAVLSDANRVACWQAFMTGDVPSIPVILQSIGITKQDLRAAIDATDAWAEANDTSFNSALPQPARGSLTAKQKAMMLMIVIAKRHGVL